MQVKWVDGDAFFLRDLRWRVLQLGSSGRVLRC